MQNETNTRCCEQNEQHVTNAVMAAVNAALRHEAGTVLPNTTVPWQMFVAHMGLAPLSTPAAREHLHGYHIPLAVSLTLLQTSPEARALYPVLICETHNQIVVDATFFPHGVMLCGFLTPLTVDNSRMLITQGVSNAAQLMHTATMVRPLDTHGSLVHMAWDMTWFGVERYHFPWHRWVPPALMNTLGTSFADAQSPTGVDFLHFLADRTAIMCGFELHKEQCRQRITGSQVLQQLGLRTRAQVSEMLMCLLAVFLGERGETMSTIPSEPSDKWQQLEGSGGDAGCHGDADEGVLSVAIDEMFGVNQDIPIDIRAALGMCTAGDSREAATRHNASAGAAASTGRPQPEPRGGSGSPTTTCAQKDDTEEECTIDFVQLCKDPSFKEMFAAMAQAEFNGSSDSSCEVDARLSKELLRMTAEAVLGSTTGGRDDGAPNTTTPESR